jgi:hypothetical protein
VADASSEGFEWLTPAQLEVSTANQTFLPLPPSHQSCGSADVRCHE